jgi:hypothetical protein
LAVAPALKVRFEKYAEALPCDVGFDHTPSEADDIGVVVLPAESRAMHIVHQRGADLGKAVGGDADPDTATADQNSSFRATIAQSIRHPVSHIRIINRLIIVNTKIENIALHCRQFSFERPL